MHPLGLGGGTGVVAALAVLGDDLIAGGEFDTAGGVPALRIAKWNGSVWTAIGSGMNGSVAELTVASNELIAGGSFTTASGTPANRIARWNGAAWQPFGAGVDDDVLCAIYHDGEILAGGDFTIAGDVLSYHWGRWASACSVGDLNCDHSIDSIDATQFIGILLDPTNLDPCAAHAANINGDLSMNGEPIIDGNDIQPFVDLLIAP